VMSIMCMCACFYLHSYLISGDFSLISQVNRNCKACLCLTPFSVFEFYVVKVDVIG